MSSKNIHRTFFFLLLVCLPVQLNFYFWPEWSMVLGRRIDLLAPSFYFTDLLLLGTVISWLANTYKTINVKRHLAFLLSGLLVVVTNTFFSNNPTLTLFFWLQFAKFALLTLYIIATAPPLILISKGLVFGAIGAVFIGLTQVFLQQSLGGMFYFLGERTFSIATPGIAKAVLCLGNSCETFLRAYATFPHPNVFGGYLVFVISLLLLKKNTSRLLLLFLFTGLLATFSRSALLGLGAAWLWSRQKALTLMLFLLVFLTTLPSSLLFFEERESFAVRQDLIRASWQMFQEQPIVGIGLKQFIPLLPSFLVRRDIYFLQPVHNVYVLTLVELGVAGVLLLFFLFHYWLKQFNLTVNSSRLILLIPLLFIGVLDHYLLSLHQGLLLLAISAGLIIQKRSILKE